VIVDNTIILGDCLEVMKQIPDKSIDLVLTDPPYGIGYDRQQSKMADNGRVSNGGKWKKYKKTEWDNKTPNKIVFDEIIRVSKNQIIFGGNYFNYLHLGGVIIWYKGSNGKLKEGELAKTSFNTFRVFYMSRTDAYINNGMDKQHPTQKPVELMKWCLDNYSKEGQTILDPFAGSGTTAIACHDLKRNFICIEKEPEYHRIATDRYNTHKAQLNLF